MGDWRDHVVPDWVVDDYNSRVSAEDRLPLPTGRTYEDTDMDTGSYSCSNTYTRYRTSSESDDEPDCREIYERYKLIFCLFAIVTVMILLILLIPMFFELIMILGAFGLLCEFLKS